MDVGNVSEANLECNNVQKLLASKSLLKKKRSILIFKTCSLLRVSELAVRNAKF